MVDAGVEFIGPASESHVGAAELAALAVWFLPAVAEMGRAEPVLLSRGMLDSPPLRTVW